MQYLPRVRNFAVQRHPKLVIVFLFANDIETRTGTGRRPNADFIDTGHAREAGIMSRDALLAEDIEPRGWDALSWASVRHQMLTYQTLRFYWSRWKAGRAFSTEAPPVDGMAIAPDRSVSLQLTPNEELAVGYLRRATQMMVDSTREAHARFLLAYIPGLQSFTYRNDKLVARYGRESADAAGVPFLDLTQAMSAGDGVPRPGMYLPIDGHLTENGHRRVAQNLAAFVREMHLLDP